MHICLMHFSIRAVALPCAREERVSSIKLLFATKQNLCTNSRETLANTDCVITSTTSGAGLIQNFIQKPYLQFSAKRLSRSTYDANRQEVLLRVRDLLIIAISPRRDTGSKSARALTCVWTTPSCKMILSPQESCYEEVHVNDCSCRWCLFIRYEWKR